MENLKVSIDNYSLSELIKHKKIQEVESILSSKNIALEFDINTEPSYRGFCIKDVTKTYSYTIHVNVKESLKEDIINFNIRGVLGDIFNPEAKLFVPKNTEDIGVYSILFTILHEYKHYIQYIEGRLDGVDTSLGENNKYISKEALILEEEAEEFALENICDLMQGYYTCLEFNSKKIN